MRQVGEPKACSVRWNKTTQPCSSVPAGPDQPGSWGSRFSRQPFLGSHSERCHKKLYSYISLRFSDSPFNWEVLVKDLIGSSLTILNVFTKSYVTDFRNVFYFCSDAVSWHHWSACKYMNTLIQDSRFANLKEGTRNKDWACCLQSRLMIALEILAPCSRVQGREYIRDRYSRQDKFKAMMCSFALFRKSSPTTRWCSYVLVRDVHM
jgi:hypothetical protein